MMDEALPRRNDESPQKSNPVLETSLADWKSDNADDTKNAVRVKDEIDEQLTDPQQDESQSDTKLLPALQKIEKSVGEVICQDAKEVVAGGRKIINKRRERRKRNKPKQLAKMGALSPNSLRKQQLQLAAKKIKKKLKRKQRSSEKKEAKRLAMLGSLSENFNQEQLERAGLGS